MSKDNYGLSAFVTHIQGLRAIAVVAVIVYHFTPVLPAGYLGVDMFFVISGYVITLSIVNGVKRRTFSVRNFLLRRYWRLAPALVATVFTTLILSSLILPPLGRLQDAALTGFAAIVGVSNVAIAILSGDYFNPNAALNPLLHTWSLSLEAQFYAGLAIVIALSFAFGLQRIPRPLLFAAFFALVALSLGSFLAFSGDSQGLLGHMFGFYSPLSRAWQFALGSVLALPAVVEKLGATLFSRLAQIAPVCLAILFLGLLGVFGTSYGQGGALAVTLATASLLPGRFSPASTFSRIVSSRPMLWIGDRSYSIYLWHWPVFLFLGEITNLNEFQAPLAAIVTALVGALSFRYFESPVLGKESRSHSHLRRNSALLTFLAVPLAISLWFIPRTIWEDRFETATEKPPGYELGCHGPVGNSDSLAICDWPSNLEEISEEVVYLIGDSNAAMYTEGLRRATQIESARLRVATASGCPYLGGLEVWQAPNNGYRACVEWQELVSEHLRKAPPSTVVLGFSGDYWTWNDRFVRELNGQPISNRTERQEVLSVALRRTILELEKSGHKVYVLNPIPHWEGEFSWALRECKLLDILQGCSMEMPLGLFEMKNESMYKSVEASLSYTSATLIDLNSAICPAGNCQTGDERIQIYKDSTHITNEYSIELTKRFITTLIE